MPPAGCLAELAGAVCQLVRGEKDHRSGLDAGQGVEGGGEVSLPVGPQTQVQGEFRGVFHRLRGDRLGGGGCGGGSGSAAVLALVVAVVLAAHHGGGGANEQGVAENDVSVLHPQQGPVLSVVEGVGQAEVPAQGIGGDIVNPVLPDHGSGDRGIAVHRGGGAVYQVKGHGFAGEVIEHQVVAAFGKAVVDPEVHPGDPAAEGGDGDVDPAAVLDGGGLGGLGSQGVVEGEEEQAVPGGGGHRQQRQQQGGRAEQRRQLLFHAVSPFSSVFFPFYHEMGRFSIAILAGLRYHKGE